MGHSGGYAGMALRRLWSMAKPQRASYTTRSAGLPELSLPQLPAAVSKSRDVMEFCR